MNSTSNNIKKTERHFFQRFGSRQIMTVATVLILTGYLLMSGSGSTEQSFNTDIFSIRRIVIAPIVCLSGYLMMIIGILRKGTVKTERRDSWVITIRCGTIRFRILFFVKKCIISKTFITFAPNFYFIYYEETILIIVCSQFIDFDNGSGKVWVR